MSEITPEIRARYVPGADDDWIRQIEARNATYDAIYGQDNPRTPDGAWIQWKGTKVCADVWCSACGDSAHVDAEFFYYYRCPACDAIYAVGQNIKLIPLTPEQRATAEQLACVVTGD